MGLPKVKKKVHKRSHKQKVWEFMRRNRQFVVRDIMIILSVNEAFLMPVFRALELAGYLELVEAEGDYKDRVYKLLKDTGVRSPVIIKRKAGAEPYDRVQDINTDEIIILNGQHRAGLHDRLALLKAMSDVEMSREEIVTKACMNINSSRSIRYFSEFVGDEIVLRAGRKADKRFYIIDKEKRDALIKTLQSRV